MKSSKGLISIGGGTKYTATYHEKDHTSLAPHHFDVYSKDEGEHLGGVNFQEGTISENGVNGVTNEDLLLMVITRLEHWQNSEFRCRENALALTKLEEAIMWLGKRTKDREDRGVDDTRKV